MNGISAKKLARDRGIPIKRLMAQLKEAGIAVSSEDDPISGNDQLKFLQHIRANESKDEPGKEVTLSDIELSADLRELNQLLTQAMAERKIQALIKDNNLDSVVEKVVELNQETDEHELLSAAILGRLAAVARSSREQVIFDRADEIFSSEPASIETLEDGDAKSYAATVISYCSASWTREYSYREALAIDTADNARGELLAANLVREESIAAWLSAITDHVTVLRGFENAEARLKRVRRIFGVMRDIAERWRGDVGAEVGARLADCMKAFLTGKLGELDQAVLFGSIDHLLTILRRVIELRFSTALYATTYGMLDQGKKLLGPGVWGRFIDQSVVLPEIRVALLEAALVLARQNRQYKEILSCLLACYTSRPQVAAAIKRHFQDARDLDPEVAEWWRTAGGESEGRRHVEHKVGNNEDAQIGALLIEVDSNREAMGKVGRAVVPLLEISEPVLASTVKKAVDGYQGIDQTARRLARMRKLTKTDLKGERLEYNPLEHELLGGHKAGVRRVKVVRDGIKKEFAGKIKTLVKPWVEPDEE
ncbi:hypothetical protein [Halochromatium roseum]|uniref:hypothetical protein n=1 Tax=Halochromatium roseum TaxID=391920 RepID=UPI001914AEB7|nr:hypothetical protein [Halochromatium roseum]MBK5938929.1 hypothetical protein [Halochromatium roseum]